MSDRETRVVIAAPTYGSPLQISMIEIFKKLFKPEEMALRSLTGEADMQKDRLRQALEQTRPTALIALDIRPDPDIVALYKTANVPIILFDEEAAGVSTITIDNYKGGHMAGEYLAVKGKKKIAIVTGRTKIQGGYNAERRLRGFQQALKEKGLSLPNGYVIEIKYYSREDGIDVMPKLLAMGIDSIFCAAGDNCAKDY